jgi:hypothetical protein
MTIHTCGCSTAPHRLDKKSPADMTIHI